MKRRAFIKTTLASGAVLALPAYGQAPAVITSERMRPQATSGLQIGDVTGDRALIWSRADRPARMMVERSFHPDFRDAVRLRGPLALESTDYTARVDLTGLPAGREVFVRVAIEKAVFGGDPSGLAAIGNWNLDSGQDAAGKFAFWS